MLGSRADDGTAGQETLKVEPDVTLGRGFAASMLGPIQRTSHQLDGGSVHDLDEAFFETEGEARHVPAAEFGLESLQMFEHRPEEFFGQLRIAGAVGMGESVFVRRRGAAQRQERTGVQPQSVTHIIEAKGVSQLREEQTDDVAPRTEGAGVVFNARVVRQFGNQVCRNQIANLAENRELAGRWLVSGFLFHALPCGKAQTRKPTFFTSQPSTHLGQQ